MTRDRIDLFIESLSDWADAHGKALTRIDSTLATLVESQTNLTLKIDKLSDKIDKLSDKIDLLSQVTQAQQVVAQSQSENVAALIAHANSLLASKLG